MLPVLSLQTFAAEAQTGETPVCYEHGDVNADGKVDSRDAIRALYHSIFEENPEYAVSQDCDFNRDGTVDSKDAMYVLYSTFSIFHESYPLEGTVHEYFEPEWTWEEDGSVTVVLKCGCGETHSFTSEDGVTIQAGKDTEVTCVKCRREGAGRLRYLRREDLHQHQDCDHPCCRPSDGRPAELYRRQQVLCL